MLYSFTGGIIDHSERNLVSPIARRKMLIKEKTLFFRRFRIAILKKLRIVYSTIQPGYRYYI